MPEPSKAVLITGCSTGIGRATALRLAGGGWTVYATARRPETVADLQEAGCRTLSLDVTDEASMTAAVRAVEEAEGAVGVLVNNAGYSQGGAVETVPMESVRRQFETNVFGLVRLTQLVLPKMRAQRWGRIVNIGSMGGRLTFPGGGHYHATKHALEALSDALRFELAGFGIAVVLVEPGLITTEFGETAAGAMASVSGAVDEGREGGGREGGGRDEGGRDEGGRDPYTIFNTAVATATKEVYEGPMRRLGGAPDRVARTIEKAIGRRRPPARITVTPSAKLTIGLRRLLSDRAWDAAMRGQFPQPR